MTPLVSQLWPQFMADPAFASCFGQVIVEHARMLRQSQQVIFTLRSAAPLDKGLCARLLASLQPDYEGFELKIENHFGYAMLDEAALRDLLEEMKADGVPINGFLDRCSITILGQSITVGVRHGTKFLQEMGFEKLLADCIARHTGVTPKVSLISAVSEAEQHQMEEKLERKIAPPVVKFEKKNTAPSIKVEGLDLTDKPVTIFHGKMFTPKNLTPLKDLGGEGGKCTIWGDVFFTEVKGNYRKIYTVSITDYTGSINLKIRAQEGEDCSKWESIGKGTTVIVRGDCSYDKYEHDYIVYPYDVLFVERKKREDTAPVKRVELHLHTKLSSMDGFCDPGGIVRLAHRMGHPAIAITDHGVCQGYPEAMLAADDIHKKDPDFKLIYGCEAYFVDDMIPCVYGVQEQPLTGEFCVFDTETTGLDPGVEYMTEIGGVIVRNGEVMEEFDTFVKPGKPITPKITEITGITNEMVADAPSEKEALEAFLKFAGGRILVGHNVHSFDMRFLRAAAKRSGISLENVTAQRAHLPHHAPVRRDDAHRARFIRDLGRGRPGVRRHRQAVPAQIQREKRNVRVPHHHLPPDGRRVDAAQRRADVHAERSELAHDRVFAERGRNVCADLPHPRADKIRHDAERRQPCQQRRPRQQPREHEGHAVPLENVHPAAGTAHARAQFSEIAERQRRIHPVPRHALHAPQPHAALRAGIEEARQARARHAHAHFPRRPPQQPLDHSAPSSPGRNATERMSPSTASSPSVSAVRCSPSPSMRTSHRRHFTRSTVSSYSTMPQWFSIVARCRPSSSTCGSNSSNPSNAISIPPSLTVCAYAFRFAHNFSTGGG